MFDLTGRTALVTGASGGIGRAIAQALSEAGAKVALSGTRENVLEEVAGTLKGESAIVPCNLSDAESVDGLVGRAEEAIGPLDILVANAGITRDKLLMQMKDDDWNDVLSVNLGSYFRLTKSCVRGMMKRRHGRIIGITSIVGVTGFIESPMTDVLPEKQKEALLGQIPAGRLGQGADIAAAAVYLASDQAAYVTGQTLHVNGGMAMI